MTLRDHLVKAVFVVSDLEARLCSQGCALHAGFKFFNKLVDVLARFGAQVKPSYRALRDK
jgi:hypothetical protein